MDCLSISLYCSRSSHRPFYTVLCRSYVCDYSDHMMHSSFFTHEDSLMSRETVNSYALHACLYFNMLSPLIRLITNHRDIMQQQLNFMPLLLYPVLLVVYAPVQVSIHRYTLQRQSFIAEFDSVLFRLKFTVLPWSILQLMQQRWLVVTLNILIASVCIQPSCCLRARGRHVQQLLLMIC